MMLDLFTESSALLSEDRAYRYNLSRVWDRGAARACFVMLNPSVADESVNDATIRRCIGYARNWRYGGIDVVNLFAYRATDPAEMMKAEDPIGPENDAHIIETCKRASLVVCAWGAHGIYRGRDEQVLRLLSGLNIAPHYLARTGDGSPRHPLRLRADLKPQPMMIEHFKEAA